MQKSVLAIWVFLFLFLFGLPSLAFGKTKPLHLVCDHWPPYQISQEEKLTGFSASLVDLVFKQMGISMASLRVYPWKRSLAYLEKGQADALFSANFNPARTEFAWYPEEKLIDSPWVLWGKKTGEHREIAYSDLANRQSVLCQGILIPRHSGSSSQPTVIIPQLPVTNRTLKNLLRAGWTMQWQNWETDSI